MKLRVLAMLSLAMAVCLSSALLAQDEEGGRRRGRGGDAAGQGRGPGGPGAGGPGGFGRGVMMARGGVGLGGALDLMGLLRDEKVRAELGMSEETYTAAREAMPNMRELLTASDEEKKSANEKAKEVLEEVLTPEKQKRLMGLYVQQSGMRAASNELVAKEIGLDEAGTKKVREALEKVAASNQEKMREMFQSGDRDKMREAMQGAQKEVEEALKDVLTDPQEKALEELKGEKFEFSEQGFGFGGGGRGGEAPAGGRGRGIRGNDR